MNTGKEKRYVVDVLFVLALFLVFVVSAVLLIALGANVYRKNMDSMAQNYTYRSSHAYLAEKVRSADAQNAVSIGELNGQQALLLRQDINGIPYTTYLYFHEGYLTELFCKSEVHLPPSAGMKLLPLRDISFSPVRGNAIRADITEEDGYSHAVLLALRAFEGNDNGETD